jgi:tetratricopeptide (TPR) repeat protein
MGISPAELGRIRDLYDRGLFLQAHAESIRFGPLRGWRGPAGLLAGRLASHLGAPRLASALIMRAWRAQRTDPDAAYYHAYTIRRRRGPWHAWRFVQAQPDLETDGATRGHWYGLTAALAADFRDFESADEWLRRADEASPGDHWLALERADVLIGQDRYDEALACVRRSLALRPGNVQALHRVAHLLPILGRVEEALGLLAQAEQKTESGGLSWQHANLLAAQGRNTEAEQRIARTVELWPLVEKEARSWIAGLRADLARLAGDDKASVEHSRSAGNAFQTAVAENLLRAAADGSRPRRMQIAVPFVQQQHLTCVPASSASVARFWQRPIDPLEMARAVTYNGTPGHKARSWMEEAGWVTREFRVTAEATEALISQGLPFTLVTVFPSSAHEQVVVGFDAGRRTLLIQDPSQFFVLEALVDRVVEDQRPFGPRGLLLVPREKVALIEGLELPDAPLYDQLYALERAVERHDRDRAEACLRALEAAAPDHLLVNRARQVLASYDGDVPALLECADEVIRRFPDCIPALHTRLWALHSLGRQGEASALVAELCERPGLAPYFVESYAQYLSHDARLLPRSLRLVERALRLRPFEPRVLANAAEVLWRADRRTEAFALRRLAACLDDHSEDFITSYFATARHFRQVEEPLAWLRKRHQRLGAQSSQPLRSLFWALEELGRADEGFESLEQALAGSEDGELLAYAADAHARYGKNEQAARLLEGARGRCRPPVWLRTAATLAAQSGEAARALEFWRQVIENEPVATDAHAEIASLTASQQGRPAAIAHLRGAAESFPHHHGLHMAWYEWARGEDADAGESVLRRMIGINPKDAWARRELALLLGRRRAFDDAQAELGLARALDPRSPSWFSVAGLVASLAGRVDEARAAYQEAVRVDVNLTAAIDGLLGLPLTAAERREDLQRVHAEIVQQVLFGDSLFAYRVHARALLDGADVLASLRAALEARPDLWQAWSAVARQLRDMGRLEEAAAEIDSACDRFPLVPQVWLDRAHTARLRGDAEAERASLIKALETGSGWGFAARRLAELCEASDPAASRKRLEQAVARAPLDAGNHAQLADLLWRAGEREGALRHIERAGEIDPTHDPFWETSVRWDREQGTPERTLDRARRLTAKRPGDAQCWMILARVLGERSSLEERLASLDRAIAVAPHFLEAYDLKAELLAENQRFEEAIAVCRPALWGARVPRELRGREAWVASVRGDTAGAITSMRRILEQEPDYYWGWARLADWHRAVDDDDGYVAAAEQLVRLAPHQAVPLGYRGDAFRRKGRHDEAKADFQRALALDRDYVFARNALASLLVGQGEGQHAIEVLDAFPAHDVDEYELGLRVRAHVLSKRYADAAAQLKRVLLMPAANVEPIARAIRCSSAYDWERRVEAVVLELGGRPEAHPHAARHAVAVLAGRRRWRACRRRIAALTPRTEARRGAIQEYLERTAEAPVPWVLRWFIARRRDELRSDTSLWGTVGYALFTIGLDRPTRAWLADWKQRPDAEPWMLLNLGLSLRRSGHPAQAREVSEAALRLRPDNSRMDHVLWLALDGFVDGESGKAGESLDSIAPPGEKEAYRRFLWRLAHSARAVSAGGPFETFRAEVKALVRECAWFIRNREMVRTHARLVRSLARRHGTRLDVMWAALHSLTAALRAVSIR